MGGTGPVANVGLALFTSRGLRTVSFMAASDLPMPLLVRMGEAVLAAGDTLDPSAVADELIGADVTAGRLTAQQARREHDNYRAGVVRAFAALAGLGAVTDHGDFPPLVTVKPGELLTTQPGADAHEYSDETSVEAVAIAGLLSLPARGSGAGLRRGRLEVAAADRWLARSVPGYRELASNAAEAWQLLADLHDRGLLDVSAAPSRQLITGQTVHDHRLPDGFTAALSGKAARAAEEIKALRDFFKNTATCANRKFADYFGVADLAVGCCCSPLNRCSACWDYRADWVPGETTPATAQALLTPRPKAAGWRSDAAAKARRLDDQLERLIWHVYRGVSARTLLLALKGEDGWYYARQRRRIRLPHALVQHRLFGANFSVTLPQIDESLARLAEAGTIVAEETRWRLAEHVRRDQRRQRRRGPGGSGGGDAMTATAASLWRPYEDKPLFTADLVRGFDTLGSDTVEQLTDYLTALVAQRAAPVHVNVAFNALYFGWDLAYGGYVGGPIDFNRFRSVVFGQTTDALPVGAMVQIETGGDPLFAEVIYKEGAHPLLGSDGDLPAWLSGAPAGAAAPGQSSEPGTEPVLTERLVCDYDAFGQGSASTAQLDRLRRRGRWIDADGHLLLESRYASAADAEADDVDYYARYLLGPARAQLLEGPLPLLLSDGAGEEQLAAAVRALAAVADALAAAESVRMWRGYAIARDRFAARLRNDGPLGGADLVAVTTAVARTAAGPPRRQVVRPGAAPPRPPLAVFHTAIGPLLRTFSGADVRLVGTGYAEAVCHANRALADYATRDSDERGVLPNNVHLRLDDPWQGGGVWRSSAPPGPYATLDPLLPLGLGWLDSRPQEPDESGTEPDAGDTPAQLLSVTDSHLVWSAALRLSHAIAGTIPLPERVADELADHGPLDTTLRVALTHDGYQLQPDEATQPAGTAKDGGRVLLRGLSWPLEFFPGIILTFSWQRGAVLIRARTTLLEEAVVVDGEMYEHRFNPAIVTRDAAPGSARRGRHGVGGQLSLRDRILRAIRQVGLLDPDGTAVLARDRLPDLVYGAGVGSSAVEALAPVVTDLLRSGVLEADVADRIGAGLRWPSTGSGSAVEVLVWRMNQAAAIPARRPTPAPAEAAQPTEAAQVSEYNVPA